MNNPYLDKRNNGTTYLIDWLAYSVMFFLILLPFIEHGWMKVASVALIFGFFAGILNSFLREYYAYQSEDHSKVGTVNRVTGERIPKTFTYKEDYKPSVSYRSIPDKDYKCATSERTPD